METKTMPYPSKRVWIVGCIALAACVGLAAAGVSYSSRTEFCLSCHEMRVYQDELMLSPHAKDAQGKAIGCSQCHIPSGNLARMLGAKAWMGIKDLWVHNVEVADDGALLFAVEGSRVVLIIHDVKLRILGGENFFGFSFVKLFPFFHVHRLLCIHIFLML